MYDKIARYFEDQLPGFTIQFDNNETKLDTTINTTHAIMRIAGSEVGLQGENYTEDISLTLNFLINLEEDVDQKINQIREFIKNNQSNMFSLTGFDYYFVPYFQGLSNQSDPLLLNGSKYEVYQVFLNIKLLEDILISDSLKLYVGDDQLTNVLDYDESSSIQVDPIQTAESAVPKFNRLTLSRTFNIVYLPRKNDAASNALFTLHLDKTSSRTITFKKQWEDLINEEITCKLLSFTIKLTKGNQSIVTIGLSEVSNG